MRDFPPTNERRSQGLLRTYERSPRGPSAVLPRKSTPNTPRQQPNRYKTLPTRPKRPISASFARAGRTLYRFHHHDPQQGELCTALTITMPSRENFVPRPAPNPVQNSPCSAGPSAQPVQNSPNTPKKAYFSPFYPSRENFVPLSPPCPPAGRTLYRSHHHDAQQGELCTAPSAKPGTKLSQHAHTSSPTGTKLSQHAQNCRFQPVLPEQGELCTALTTTTPAGRTFYRTQRQTRYKTLPTRPRQQPNRYKTLPTRPKRPISASFARAGRTLYRIHHHDPSRENFVPHQQPNRYKTLPVQPIHRPNRYKTLPTHPASSPTGTKLSPHTQKGPFQPVLPEQGELCTASTPMPPSWENFVPLPSPRPPAGRTLYRTPSQSRYKTLPAQPVQALTRYKTLPAHPHQQPNRYKTLPTRPKRPISARFGGAGRTLYRTSSPTGTKLSQHTRSIAVPRKSSPSIPHTTTEPRKSSPSTPKNSVFRLSCACWASFVAHKQPTGHAGRVFSRSMVRTDSPGGSFHWDRLLEPMSVAHGCDNGETTAGGASLRCLLGRVQLSVYPSFV